MDGIAAMQIQAINSVVDLARVEVMERYCPGENDRTPAALKVAHIDEVRYFIQRVQQDMDGIIRDICNTHRTDSTSASVMPIATQMKEAINKAAEAKGGTQEKQLVALLGILGIDYNKLSVDEVQVIIKALEKS